MQAFRPNRRTGKNKCCLKCDGVFYQRKSESNKKYCSKTCADISRRKYTREIHSCKYCLKQFVYTPRPNSNSPGSYCSLKCRNTAYSENTVKYGHREHRPRWRAVRNRFVQAGNDFCCDCGVQPSRLYVHHIEPYRLCLSDNPDNLISLCGKCHSKHEKISNLIEKISSPEKRKLAVSIVQAHMQDYWHLHKGQKNCLT